MRLLMVSTFVLGFCLLVQGQGKGQRKKPTFAVDQNTKKTVDQGIEPCLPSSSRRNVNYGYGQLKEVGIYDDNGDALELKDKKMNMKINQKYRIKLKFDAKKFSPFGSYPKYFGIKVTENFTYADENSKKAFQLSQKKDLLGVQECTLNLKGSRDDHDADGCKWLTEGYQDACPISNKDDTEIEIDFLFLVPRLVNAVSETKFRLVGTEEEVDDRGCDGLLDPAFPNPIITTSDLDMICFKYPTIYVQ